MITLLPIHKNIQSTLHEKIGMLSRDIPTRPINETQTEEEAVAEDEAAFEDTTQTVMEIPNELVPAVRDLLSKHQA